MSFSYLPLFFLLALAPLSAAYKLNAFYANWQAYHDYPVCKIPAEKISRVFYDFFQHTGCYFNDGYLETEREGPIDGVCGSPDQPWNDPLRGNLYQFLQLKKRFPHLQVIANLIGGAVMHTAMLSPTLRQNWVQTCSDMLASYPSVFDGLNINLQYPCVADDPYCNGITPSDDDRSQFSAFVKLFRDSLPPGAYLSVTLSIDPKKYEAVDFSYLTMYVDEFHVQAYNVADGSWSTYSGHAAPAYSNPADPDFINRGQFSVENAANTLINLGVAPQKIYIGIPFFGRGFQVATTQYTSPFELSYGSTQTGTLVGNTVMTNIFYYWDIKAKYLSTRPDTYHFDPVSMAPFIWDDVNGIFISFDDVASVRAKIDIIKSLGLGGVFCWELAMDYDGELLEAARPLCVAQDNCQLPSKNIPGGLSLEETPQFIVIQLEDALTAFDFKNIGEHARLLKNQDPTYPILDALGCIPRFTGYFSGRYTDYNVINYVGRVGSVGMRGYSMSTSFSTVPEVWANELNSLQRDFFNLAQITPVGSRAPFFQANEAYYNQLFNMGIKFDSSMVWFDGYTKIAYWPFTLDYPDVIDENICNYFGKCPTQAYPGLWEFPLSSFDYGNPENCFNYQVTQENYDQMLADFKANFYDTYSTNKAPRTINLRWNYFSNGWFDTVNDIRMRFVLELLNWITTSHPDVIFATESQVIEWIKNPIPLSQLLQEWAGKCPDPSLSPETACSDGIQERCNYYGGISTDAGFVACGTLCPNVLPDVWNTYNMIDHAQDSLSEMYSLTGSSSTAGSMVGSGADSTGSGGSTGGSTDGSTNGTSNGTTEGSTSNGTTDGSTNGTSNGTTNDSSNETSNGTTDGTNANGSTDGSTGGSTDGSTGGSGGSAPATVPGPYSSQPYSSWPGIVTLSIISDGWDNTYTVNFAVINPDVKMAQGYVFTVRYCSSSIFLKRAFGGGQYSTVPTQDGNMWTAEILSPGWFWATYQSTINYAMNIGWAGMRIPVSLPDDQAVLTYFQEHLAVGVELYESPLTCVPGTCQPTCGGSVWSLLQLQGYSGPAQCNLDVSSILQC